MKAVAVLLRTDVGDTTSLDVQVDDIDPALIGHARQFSTFSKFSIPGPADDTAVLAALAARYPDHTAYLDVTTWQAVVDQMLTDHGVSL